MRVGSFMIGNDQDNSVDISITSSPGDVGGLLANVNRWIGQIDLPPINDASLPGKYCSLLNYPLLMVISLKHMEKERFTRWHSIS